MNNLSNCTICKAQLHGKQTKFCSQSCKNKMLQSYQAQKARGLSRKLELIKRFGGRCAICGYGKNLAVLSFHHCESDKEFKLDMRSLSNRTFEKILTEIEKCTLLCQNCHAEVHNPSLDLAKLLSEAGRSNH